MIVCRKCGFNNADADTFCGSCGTFLEWTGQKVAQPAPPAAAVPGAAPVAPTVAKEPEGKATFLDRMQRRVLYGGIGSKEKIERPAIVPGTPGSVPPRPGMAPPPRPGMPPGAPGGSPPGAMPGAPGPPRPPGPPGMAPGAPGMAPVAPGGPPIGQPSGAPGPPQSPGVPGMAPATPGVALGPPPVAALPPVAAPPAAAPPPPAAAVPPAANPGIAYAVGPVEPVPPPPPRALPMETQVFMPGGGPPIPASGPTPPAPPPPAPLSWSRPGGGSSPATPQASAPGPVAPRAIPPRPAGPAAPPPPAGRPPAPPQFQVGAPGAQVPAPPAPPPSVPGAPPMMAAAAIGSPPGITGGAGQPAAVRPGEARPRPPAVARGAALTRTLQQGDLICADCGEGNDAARKFCRRCGKSLAEAEVHSIPWYRRLFHRGGDEDGGTHADGPKQRPGLVERSQNVLAFMRTTGLAVALVVIVALMAIPGVRKPVTDEAAQAYRWGRNIIAPSFNPVHAINATASSSLPGHAAAFIKDGTLAYWETDTRTDTKPVITFDMGEPTDIDAVTITTGASDTPDAVGKPTAVHLIFLDQGGTAISAQDINLTQDTTKEQQFDTSARGARTVTLTIEKFQPGNGGATTVAITEVGFFTRS